MLALFSWFGCSLSKQSAPEHFQDHKEKSSDAFLSLDPLPKTKASAKISPSKPLDPLKMSPKTFEAPSSSVAPSLASDAAFSALESKVLSLEKGFFDKEMERIKHQSLTPIIQQPAELSKEASLSNDKESVPILGQKARKQRNPLSIGQDPKSIATLEEAFVAGFYFSTELEAARVQLKLLVESVAQVLAEFRPRLALEGSQRFQKETSHTKENIPVLPDIPVSRFKDRQKGSQNHLALTLSQSLYSGGTTLAKRDKAKQEFCSGIFNVWSQEQSVFQKVVSSYVEVVVAKEIWSMEKKNEHYLKEIYDQTIVGQQVGNQTPGDVATAKAKLADSVLRVTSAMADYKAKKARLEELVGVAVEDDLIMPDYYRDLPKTLESLKKQSRQSYPLLIAARYSLRAARFNVGAVTGEFLPSVDLSASCGPSGAVRQNRTSPMFLENKRRSGSWEKSINIGINIPLYDRGTTHAKYRAAEQQVKQARLELEKQRRQVDDLCETYYADLRSAEQNVASAKVSLDANRIAMDSAKTEYDLGLKKFLDVLQIEEYWLQSYRQYISAMARLINASYQVLLLTGRLTAKAMKLPVQSFDPMAYYNRYADSLFSLGEDEENKPLFNKNQGY